MPAEPTVVTATNKFKRDFNKIYPKEKSNSDCGFTQLGLFLVWFVFYLFDVLCCPALQQILAHGFWGLSPCPVGLYSAKHSNVHLTASTHLNSAKHRTE